MFACATRQVQPEDSWCQHYAASFFPERCAEGGQRAPTAALLRWTLDADFTPLSPPHDSISVEVCCECKRGRIFLIFFLNVQNHGSLVQDCLRLVFTCCVWMWGFFFPPSLITAFFRKEMETF